jgi:Protein of unknown function (DUF2865)
MDKQSGWMAVGAAAALFLVATAPVVRAQNFFSFFDLFGAHRQQLPMTPLPYAGEENKNNAPENYVPRSRYSRGGGSQAFCVRTCDGRHFPISGPNNQSRAASCSSLCPASETIIVYGGNIETSVTESGKLYSELPNAFRYRDELVGNCTCNGRDPAGLAAVKLEDDPTLRQGDIVAGKEGLMVAGRGAERRGASLHFSPAPDSIRSHYRRVPIVAAH